MATFFTDLVTKVNTITSDYVIAKASAVMASISGVSTTLFVIYVMLWALAMMRGSIQEPVLDAGMRMVKIGIVLGLALTIGNYQTYVYNFLWNAPDQMAQVLTAGGAKGQTNVLDTIYTSGMQVGDRVWDEIGLSNGLGASIGYAIIAVVAYAAAYAMTAYAAFLIVLCKIALAVLLAIGPICIMLVMFNATQKFFESWLGLALNYVFMTVLTGAAVALLHTILGTFIDDILGAEEVKLAAAGELLVIGLINVLVLKQIPTIASSLGGGASISTMGAITSAMKATGNQFQRRPRYGKDASGKRTQVEYKSNAGMVAGAGVKMVGAPMRAARKLYKNSQRNSVSNG